MAIHLEKIFDTVIVTVLCSFIVGQTHAAEEKDCSTSYPFKRQYKEVSCFFDNLAYVKKSDKYGFIDKTGKVIIPFEYEYIQKFSDGLAGVFKNHHWGYINAKNQIVIPLIYENIREFEKGYAVVTNEKSKKGLINTKGELIIPFIYKDISVKDNLLYVMNDKNKIGIVNLNNQVIIPLDYDFLDEFKEGYAEALKYCPFTKIFGRRSFCSFCHFCGSFWQGNFGWHTTFTHRVASLVIDRF